MAKPTSAFLSAGPSLVPSPVTATTSRLAFSRLSMIPLTSTYLSCGDERAITRSFGHISSNCCCRTYTSISQSIGWSWVVAKYPSTRIVDGHRRPLIYRPPTKTTVEPSGPTSESRLRGCGFESQPLRCRVRPWIRTSRPRAPASVTKQYNLVL